MKIAGTRAVITGAGSGIGQATALRFARGRASVVAVDIDPSTAEATARSCGAGAVAYACDVADGDAVAALASRVEDDLGPVDVLVNNAGVGLAGPFLHNTLEDWEWLRGVPGAVERNREIVPVEIESSFALSVSRFGPGPIRGLLAHAEMP